MNSPDHIREQLIDIGHRLYDHGMVAGSDGNLSARLPDGSILITASGAAKGRLTPHDFVIVDPDGHPLSGPGRPSSESAMHLYLYRTRPDVASCVHSHAPHATAFAVVGQPLPKNILPEVVLFVGPVPLTEYAPPGTPAVPESLAPFAAHHDAFLLRNHGLLTVGRTIDEAYHRHETVEHYARILSIADRLGPISTIPADDVQRLTEMRRNLRRPDTPDPAHGGNR